MTSSKLKGYDKFLFEYLELEVPKLQSLLSIVEDKNANEKFEKIDMDVDAFVLALIVRLLSEGYSNASIISFLTKVKFKIGDLTIGLLTKETARKRLSRFRKAFGEFIPMVGANKDKLEFFESVGVQNIMHYLLNKDLVEEMRPLFEEIRSRKK